MCVDGAGAGITEDGGIRECTPSGVSIHPPEQGPKNAGAIPASWKRGMTQKCGMVTARNC